MKTILFVCVGNACRSQMAEGFGRAIAKAQGREDVIIYSAGSAPAGFVAREAIEGMREKGIDISRHHSKGVFDLPLREFDIVVTMGCGDSCPYVKAGHRIDWQIPDPIGRGLPYFRQVRDDLETRVKKLLDSVE
jgi:arsenate reductase (thioredoxin)